MAYVIVDLEFNNMKDITKYYSDFYEEHSELKNIQIQNEIIEIGAVKVDKYMKEIDSIKIYIKPSIFPVINPIVNEITNIDMKLLDESGVPFKEAVKKFSDLFTEEDILCSWAKDDVIELVMNSLYYNNFDLKKFKGYIDLQEYATQILGYKKSLSLKNALKQLNIKMDSNKLHDALYDAECTLEVLKRIYKHNIIKRYIITDIYSMPALNVDDEEILIDESKLKLICPKCRNKIVIKTSIKKLKWRFLSIGICPKCNNNILCEIIVKKSFNGEIFYNEMNSIINDEMYEKYYYKINNMQNSEEIN